MQECPRCNAPLKPEKKFAIWCMKCDWNLGSGNPPALDLRSKLYNRYGQKSGDALFKKLINKPELLKKSSISISKTLAFILASLVHGLTLTFFLGGIYVATLDWFNFLAVFVGILLIAAAYALMPRFDSLPEEGVLTREEAPTLYKFVDEVATRMGTKTIDTICLSPDINASFSRYGIANKSLLTIGIPLWLGLNKEQQTALIGHELAHQINGDQARGFWVGTAISALASWYFFLKQPYMEDSGFGEMLVQITLSIIGTIVGWYGQILIHLFWADSQKAEYLADHLGAKISGSNEFISLNNRIALLSMHHDWLIAKVKDKYDDQQNIIPSFVAEFENTPEAEIERVRRINKKELFALDATHPPTHYRNEMLQNFTTDGSVKMSQEEENKINQEVSAHNELMGKLIIREFSHLL